MKIFNWFKTKNKFEIIDPRGVPFHIQHFSRIFPITQTIPDNKAVGEIKILRFKDKNKIFHPGQNFIYTNKDGETEIWVFLGFDYFKLIKKS